MTWVIGTSSIASQAVLISDVQVKFATGEYRDLLQKAYMISNHVAAGFAGSVKIGFSLLDSLSVHLRISEEQKSTYAWNPRWIADTWPKIARATFLKHHETERKLGAALLIVAISPTEDRGVAEFPKVFLIRCNSPDFKPGIITRGFQSCSIGSGAGVQKYKSALNQLCRMQSGSHQAEVGKPFGWADTLCFALSRTAIENQVAGVSSHFNLLAFNRSAPPFITNSDHNTYSKDGTSKIEHRMPSVAQSYSEFQSMCQVTGQNSESALC
jgi:hypothetical protein